MPLGLGECAGHGRRIAGMGAAGDARRADAGQQRGVVGKTFAEIGVQVDGSLGHSRRSPRLASNSAGSIGSNRIRSPARIGK